MPSPSHSIRKLDSEWEDEAECSRAITNNPELKSAWIINPELPNEHRETAKTICRTLCPVRLECAVNAVNDEFAQGIRAAAEFDAGLLLTADAKMLADELGVASRTRRRYTNLGPTVYGPSN